MSPIHHTNSKCDTVAQPDVFTQLDPILRNILTTIQQLQQNDQNTRNSKDAESSTASALVILRSQRNHLNTLKNAITSLSKTDTCASSTPLNQCDSHNDEGTTLGLTVMADYVLLPITLIMQQRHHRDTTVHSSRVAAKKQPQSKTNVSQLSSSSSSSSIRLARRSAELACMEEAAGAMNIFLNCISITLKENIASASSHNDTTDSNALPIQKREEQHRRDIGTDPPHPYSFHALKHDVIIRCLISCAMALSSINNNEPVTSTSTPSTTTIPMTKLDDGDECTLAILSCVESLLLSFPAVSPPASMGDEFTLTTIMDGALMAQLVQSCLTVIVPSSPNDFQGGNSIALGGGGGYWRKANKQLQYQGLTTLATLLGRSGCSVSSVLMWRCYLPGCFSALFKMLCHGLRFETPPSKTATITKCSKSSIVSLCLELLVDLLSRTLTLDESEVSQLSNERSRSNSDEINEVNLQRLFARHNDNTDQPLMTAVSTRQRHHDSYGHPTSLTSTPPLSKNEQQLSQFCHEVNKRLPQALTHILHLIQLHGTSVTCRAGVKLCDVILVNAYHVWDHDTPQDYKSQELTQCAVEFCIMMMAADRSGDCEDVDTDSSNSSNCSSSSVQQILSTYQKHHFSSSPSQWKNYVSVTLIPKIVDVISELPSLASKGGGREREFLKSVNLVNGFLEFFSVSKEIRSVWEASLANEGVLNLLQRCLSGVMEIDIDAATPPSSSAITPPELLCKSFLLREQQPNNDTPITTVITTQFRHLQDAQPVKKLLHSLGKSMGPSTCAIFVDSCIAQLYEDCRERQSCHCIYDLSQTMWLRRWSGLIIAVQELLWGCFHDTFSPQQQRTDKEDLMSHDKLNPLRIIHSLMTSILPLILHPTLWNLPTTASDAAVIIANKSKTNDEDEDLICQNFFHSTSLVYISKPSFSFRDNRPETSPLEEKVAASALQGNALFISSLLQFISVLNSLQKQVVLKQFLPTILLPLLEKTCSGNQTVQRSAMATLHQLAFRMGMASVGQLLSAHLDYFVEGIVTQLVSPVSSLCGSGNSKRHRGVMTMKVGSIPRRVIPSVVEVLLQCVFCDNNSLGNSVTLSLPSRIPLLVDLNGGIMTMFDSLSRRNVNKNRRGGSDDDDYNAQCLSIMRVFLVVLQSLSQSFPCTDNNHKQMEKDRDNEAASSSEVTKEPWLEMLLLEYGKNDRLDDNRLLEDDALLTPKEGFEKYHAAKIKSSRRENDDDDNSDSNNSKSEAKLSSQPTSLPHTQKTTFREEIDTVNAIMMRVTYSLSIPNLKVQIVACHVLQKGYQCLADLATTMLRLNNCHASEEETTSTTDDINEDSSISKKDNDLSTPESSNFNNPLLMTIADTWPSIRARLRGIVKQQQESHHYCHDSVILLQYMLDVLSEMCELGGDFMSSRFADDVWPLLGQLLGNFIPQNDSGNNQNVSKKNKQMITKHSSSLQQRPHGSHNYPIERRQIKQNDNKQSPLLLFAILKCLTRIYSTRHDGGCAMALIELVPATGTMILPFLSNEGDVGEAAFQLCQCLLLIDSDALWRSLTSLGCGNHRNEELVVGKTSATSLNVMGQECDERRQQGQEGNVGNSKGGIGVVRRTDGEELIVKRAVALLDFVDELDEQEVIFR